MKNSDRFIDAYNKIDKLLRKRLKGKDNYPINYRPKFSNVIDNVIKFDSGFSYYKYDLIEFDYLRNAIVHDKRENMVIAEPNDWATGYIEKISEDLSNPPKIQKIFKNKREVFILGCNDSIGNAIKKMVEEDYSQIPIYKEDNKIDLLIDNDIVRWLKQNVNENTVDLKNTKILDVLKYSSEGKILNAILVTQSGRDSEKIINIITLWDLPKIDEILKSYGKI